jgi:acetyltransferase
LPSALPGTTDRTIEWQGPTVTLRPIRPEDEKQHLRLPGKPGPEDIRMRVFYSRRSIERSELARLTQIDYTREMAFVATVPTPEGTEKTLGVARALADPDNIGAEFGIILRPELKGSGLGRVLMDKLIRYQRAAGTQRLIARALAENWRMRELARGLGFSEAPVAGETDTLHLTLALQAPQTGA